MIRNVDHYYKSFTVNCMFEDIFQSGTVRNIMIRCFAMLVSDTISEDTQKSRGTDIDKAKIDLKQYWMR